MKNFLILSNYQFKLGGCQEVTLRDRFCTVAQVGETITQQITKAMGEVVKRRTFTDQFCMVAQAKTLCTTIAPCKQERSFPQWAYSLMGSVSGIRTVRAIGHTARPYEPF